MTAETKKQKVVFTGELLPWAVSQHIHVTFPGGHVLVPLADFSARDFDAFIEAHIEAIYKMAGLENPFHK